MPVQCDFSFSVPECHTLPSLGGNMLENSEVYWKFMRLGFHSLRIKLRAVNYNKSSLTTNKHQGLRTDLVFL